MSDYEKCIQAITRQLANDKDVKTDKDGNVVELVLNKKRSK